MWESGRKRTPEVLWDLPVDDEVLVRSLLVTDRTHPGGLLLVHLDVERGVEALQMGARQRPTRDHQSHLPQLHGENANMCSGHTEDSRSGGDHGCKAFLNVINPPNPHETDW